MTCSVIPTCQYHCIYFAVPRRDKRHRHHHERPHPRHIQRDRPPQPGDHERSDLRSSDGLPRRRPSRVHERVRLPPPCPSPVLIHALSPSTEASPRGRASSQAPPRAPAGPSRSHSPPRTARSTSLCPCIRLRARSPSRARRRVRQQTRASCPRLRTRSCSTPRAVGLLGPSSTRWFATPRTAGARAGTL